MLEKPKQLINIPQGMIVPVPEKALHYSILEPKQSEVLSAQEISEIERQAFEVGHGYRIPQGWMVAFPYEIRERRERWLKEPISNLEKYVSENLEDIGGREFLASRYIKEGRVDNALAQYEAALAVWRNVRILALAANLHRIKGGMEKAGNYYREAINKDYPDPGLHSGYALYLIHAGSEVEAARELRTYLHIMLLKTKNRYDPWKEDNGYLLFSALFHTKFGREDEARKRLQPIIKGEGMDLSLAKSKFDQGLTYAVLNEMEQSTAQFKDFLLSQDTKYNPMTKAELEIRLHVFLNKKVDLS